MTLTRRQFRGVRRWPAWVRWAPAAALGSKASAQAPVTLRWWSTQSVPAQLEAYKFQIASFEAANPGIKVVFEPTSNEAYAAQLSAAFASGQVPNIVTHLPSFAVTNYWRSGLLEPFNDVIQAVGPEKFYDGANRIYEIEPGKFAGAGIGGTAANTLWLRTDLMKKAGIDEGTDHLGRAARGGRKMQGGGIYGAPLPYAKNSMTTLIFICFIHGAGGQVFTPDLEVAIDSKETLNALEFYKSMRELCPPGATGYSWGESLTAFVSGATATGIYTGRVLANVNAAESRHRGFDHLRHLSDHRGRRPVMDVQRLPQHLHPEGRKGHGGDEEVRRAPVRRRGLHQAAARRARPRAAGAEDDRG